MADPYDFGHAGRDLQAGSARLSQTAEKSLLRPCGLTKAAYPQQFVCTASPEWPETGRDRTTTRQRTRTPKPAVLLRNRLVVEPKPASQVNGLFSKCLMLFNKQVTNQLGWARVISGAQPV